MNKTIKEWVDFLDGTFALQKEGGIPARFYFSKEEFLKTYENWTDEKPIEVWVNNNHENGHLFIISQ